MFNQKEGTYNAIASVVEVNDGEKLELTKAQKVEIKAIIVRGFENEEIELKSPQDDLGKYVNGLLNNWLRKDKRLNGDIVYRAKNPGSRTGMQDPTVKNLRILKKSLADPTAIADVDLAIKERIAEIKPEKSYEVDATAIPEHLKHLIPEA